MKYLWYAFLGLFSLGCLGLIAGIVGFVYIISYYGQDLPDYKQLKDYQPSIVTRLYAGDGRLMAEFAQEKRVFMPIETIPDLVKNAFIAAEDKNFYEHEGVDPTAVLRAVSVYVQHLLGQDVNVIGGSTITQQVVKNFLLSNERKFERKIREAILAHRIERAMTKNQILELYLNEIFMGARAYGIAAAAQHYFNKSLDELDVAEAAYLAALPKAPNNYHPVRNRDEATKRRNDIIVLMQKNDFITKAEADLAKLKPLKITPHDETKIVDAPYFAEKVRRELKDRYGEDALYGGGLVARTSIDPKMQDIAIRVLREGLMAYDRRHGWRGPVTHIKDAEDWQVKLRNYGRPESLLEEWEMAVVLKTENVKAEIGFVGGGRASLPLKGVAWARKCLSECYALGPEIIRMDQVIKTGDVIMVEKVPAKDAEGNETKESTYELQQVPKIQGSIIALDPHTGRVLAMQGGWKHDTSEFNRATQAQRQPGSAFKPFVYLAALESGFTPATLVLDAPFVIEDRPGNIWKPTNYSNDFYGPTPIRVGVEKSRNLMTVRLADYIGMEKISDYAERFGITDDMPPLLANALGSGETTLLKLTSAYAMLVNGGKKITPTFIDRIQDRRGLTVFKHDKRPCEGCGHLVRWEDQNVPDVPDIREQLSDPKTSYQIVSILEGVVQRGTGIRIKSLGRPLAGKTGTTNESKDTWFIGFSPDLVVGVFAGFDEPKSLGKRETGSSVSVPIFKAFMEAALEGEPPSPFRIPPGIRQVQINGATGVRARPGDQRVIWEAFVAGTEPTDEMFILDGRGINLMPESTGDNIGESATTGTGGIY
ncbi:MAG: penicillin-binding protein 1A [Micavibrio sp.]|nr:MAG: penicillin-binding protein 1A [Micavibrio sp.]